MDEPTTQPLLSSSPWPAPGGRVGRYQVVCRLGAGGMGVVYRADDTSLSRPVALKFLAPSLVADEKAHARFAREARAAARLDHPNIGTVHEIGEWQGHPYIAYAFYEGETLAARLQRGPLSISEAESFIGQIAKGLSAAHAAGVVHRDLKPSNVILTADGPLKILDFGLAKLDLPSDPAASSLTESGAVMGTVAYMSPEQARGENVDRRTDLWAMGVIAYQMLTGLSPFVGESATTTLVKIMTFDPKPPRVLRDEIPDRLSDLVLNLLQKSREERTPHADSVLQHLSTTSPRQIERSRWRAWLPAAGAAIIGLFVVVALASHRMKDASTAPASVVALPCQVIGPESHRYLTDAIPSTLSSMLAQVPGLDSRVPPTSLQWDPAKDDLQKIAKAYEVHSCLRCTVTVTQAGLVLALSVVDPLNRRMRWSHEYQGTAEGYLDLTRRAADDARAALLPASTPGLPATSRSDAELEIQRGRYYFMLLRDHQRGEDERLAMEALEGAMRLDPKRPEPAALISLVHQVRLERGEDSAEELRQMRQWARRSLDLDPRCGLAWASLCTAEVYDSGGSRAQAIEYALKAVSASPREPRAPQVLGWALTTVSRELALPAVLEGLRLDPLYFLGIGSAFDALWGSGRTREGLPYLDRALELNQDIAYFWLAKLDVLDEIGPREEIPAALASFEARAKDQHPASTIRMVELKVDLGQNDSESAQAAKSEALRLVENLNGTQIAPIQEGLVLSLARHGEGRAAIEVLTRGAELGQVVSYDLLTKNPALATIREDPAFRAVVSKARANLDEVLKVLIAAKARGELPAYLDEPLAKAIVETTATP